MPFACLLIDFSWPNQRVAVLVRNHLSTKNTRSNHDRSLLVIAIFDSFSLLVVQHWSESCNKNACNVRWEILIKMNKNNYGVSLQNLKTIEQNTLNDFLILLYSCKNFGQEDRFYSCLINALICRKKKVSIFHFPKIKIT